MSKRQQSKNLIRQAAIRAELADCLHCVYLREFNFRRVDALLSQAGAILPSRLR